MSRRWWVPVAVIVPLVGLLVMVGQAELGRQSGETWRIPIGGFDPRDLLHGRYLRYQFQFDWRDTSTCGTATRPDPDCCLCLGRSSSGGSNPSVRQVSCQEARQCDDWLRAGPLRPPLRYFVPEDRALALENALRERAAAIDVQRGVGGQPAIGMLYLDGRPWREALDDPPTTSVP